MSCPFDHGGTRPSRRGLLAATAGLLAAASGPSLARADTALPASEPFYGPHQGGIATAQQKHSYFAAFDLATSKREDVIALLQAWTKAAARLTAGLAVEGDDGSAAGLAPQRLTLTFGFGPGLFVKDGKDRYGLAAQRPAALADLPKFHGDQLEPARTGGDLSVQACADDPQVALHAMRALMQMSYGHAQLAWVQSGFLPNTPPNETPRNLMGFKDGSNNPSPAGNELSVDLPRGFDDVVWAGDEAPQWMRGGSYLVARRIRISLEHWDRSPVDFQEEVIGRQKLSGAPIGKMREGDLLELDRADGDGNPVIPETAHVRLGAAAMNDGAQILRRAYSYNDGASFTAERWPPWRQGMMLDAGLFFVAYQRDPRTGFSKIYDNMSKLDALNQFTTHTGGGLFACPTGVREGGYIGEGLFGAAV